MGEGLDSTTVSRMPSGTRTIPVTVTREGGRGWGTETASQRTVFVDNMQGILDKVICP